MKYDLELIIDERNALSIILKQIHSKSIILEFGPANGRMTRYLKDVLECSVYIVEADIESAKDAMKYAADGIVGDIEQFEWLEKWKEIEFDYIIFADVLEHLYHPQDVLSRTKLLLKYDGKTFISVPNIGHNSVMINLYKNIFNYTSLGLLDNTHIHFFAYNTLKEFCHYAGYFPVIEDAVYSNVGENEISCNYNDVERDIANSLRKRDYGNVYQYVFTLQKEEYVKCNSFNTDYRIRKNMPVGVFKIYLDRGSGFCEDNSITYQIYLEGKFEKEIPLENCEQIRSIRIDPLDMGGIFKFTNIQVIDQEKTENWGIDKCTHNGKKAGDYLFFGHDDPQVIISDVKFKTYAKLIIEVDYIYMGIDESVINTCIDIIEKNESTSDESKKKLDMQAVELKHCMDEINFKDHEINRQKNEIILLNEEMDRRTAELDHRMSEINLRDQEIDKQKNEIILLSEEMGRRAAELDHRMDEINLRDQEINKQRIEINLRDQEIDKQKNEIILLSEEMDRRAAELNHRMDEINFRDQEIDRQKNELKLVGEEMDRRAAELEYRMDKINELQMKWNHMNSLNLRGVMKWYIEKKN